MRPSGWALNQYDWCPCQRNFRQTQKFGHVRTQGREGHPQASEESNPVNTLISAYEFLSRNITEEMSGLPRCYGIRRHVILLMTAYPPSLVMTQSFLEGLSSLGFCGFPSSSLVYASWSFSQAPLSLSTHIPGQTGSYARLLPSRFFTL